MLFVHESPRYALLYIRFWRKSHLPSFKESLGCATSVSITGVSILAANKWTFNSKLCKEKLIEILIDNNVGEVSRKMPMVSVRYIVQHKPANAWQVQPRQKADRKERHRISRAEKHQAEGHRRMRQRFSSLACYLYTSNTNSTLLSRHCN